MDDDLFGGPSNDARVVDASRHAKPSSGGHPPGNGPPDPFDPARLRLSQDFAASVGVKELLTTVPVRKPDKTWFIRTHTDPAYRIETVVIEMKDDRETYLVDPSLWAELSTESVVGPRLILTTIKRQGAVFLWPIRMPGADGKIDDWSRSAEAAAAKARDSWVRVAAKMSLGAYDVFEAVGDLPEPTWPETSFTELLRTGFKGRFIADTDHPVLRKLRGEV